MRYQDFINDLREMVETLDREAPVLHAILDAAARLTCNIEVANMCGELDYKTTANQQVKAVMDELVPLLVKAGFRQRKAG